MEHPIPHPIPCLSKSSRLALDHEAADLLGFTFTALVLHCRSTSWRPTGQRRLALRVAAKHGGVETTAETMLAPFRRKKDQVPGFEPAVIIVPKVKDGPTGEIKVWWDTRRHIYVTKDQMDLAEGGWKQ